MTLLFAVYVLVWPVLTLAVLVVICRAVARDRRSAREEERELV
ncbi:MULTISPECIES: putative transporter small subunit [Cobetia]|nr:MULTISPECIES: putative transporter small subunit [Cobetia]